MEKEKYKPTQSDRQLYSDSYKECVAAIRGTTEAYDRNLITISSGFLAVPFGLLRVLSGGRQLIGRIDFFLAAGGFVLTILCVLFSFYLSSKTLHCRLDDIREYYLEGEDQAFNRKSSWGKVLATCNILSGILFFTGTIFTVIFVYRNLGDFK